jgi:formylglycine-generating enzyme required for sulfatase activity
VTRGGVPVLSGTVVAKRLGVTVATTMIPAAGAPAGAYVLRVPLYHYLIDPATGLPEPQPPNETRVNPQSPDSLVLEVNGAPAGVASIPITDRGLVVLRDVALAAPPPTDVDEDSVGNAVDNCSGVSNAGQADANGNGIGDACEGIVNPPATAKFVGDPNNAADAATGRGRVTYTYSIGSTEVTNAQYRDFLAAVGASDPAGLYNALMGSDARGGITRQGSSGSYTYRVRPSMANKPVNFVSWLDAARYANWVHNGKPSGAQGATTTEGGAYNLTVATPGVSAVRLASATWSLPNENEWFKAAYYDAALSSYWVYPTSDLGTDPVPTTPDPIGEVSNPGSNRANHENNADWNATNPSQPLDGNTTTVDGAGVDSRSPYATADQGGNVAEWTDAAPETGLRVTRGGSYGSARALLSKNADLPGPTQRAQLLLGPDQELATVGFRVVQLAGMPEDPDGDGVLAGLDNCITARNADQRDTNGDGYGNRCDGDFDNNGTVNFIDLGIFKRCLPRGPQCDDALFQATDLDGNAAVNFQDLGVFKSLFGRAPGPSDANP